MHVPISLCCDLRIIQLHCLPVNWGFDLFPQKSLLNGKYTQSEELLAQWFNLDNDILYLDIFEG